VQVTYETLEIARAHVLQCNCKVFVVSPKELRVAVRKRARELLDIGEQFDSPQ
jgi:hypothetical protein